MPSVDVAMARSLQGGAWGTLRNAVARSVAADLARRGIIDDAQNKATDVAKAFSSWDNCMNVAWCKWPVIAVIIIGGLIIFSVIWCIIRCCCCGLSCCCSCFECFKCCGNCCGCCDPPGGKKIKNLDDPYAAPAPQHGYRTEAPMQASPSPFAPQTNHAGPPQYAQFEMQKPRNDDALPEMPSWESSNNKKVMVEQESVELSDIKKPPHSDQQQNGVVNVASPGNTSPMGGRGPYQHPKNNQSGYLAGNQAPDHYSPIDQGYGYNNKSNNGGANGYGMDQSYATGAMGAAAAVARRPSPAQSYNGHGQDSYGQTPAAQSYSHELPSNNERGGYGGFGSSSTNEQKSYGGFGSHELPSPSPSPSNNEHGSNGGFGGHELPYNNERGGYGGFGNSSNNEQKSHGGFASHELPSPSNNERGGYGGFGGHELPSNNERGGYGGFGSSSNNEQKSYGGFGGHELPSNNDPVGYGGFGGPSPGAASYGTDMQTRQSPAPGPQRTPAPYQDPYGYGQPARLTPAPPNDFSYGQSNLDRAFSPAPDRQYGVASPHPQTRPVPQRNYGDEPPQSPINNNSGFDFNSGYARPQHSPTREPYPGYKPYQPS